MTLLTPAAFPNTIVFLLSRLQGLNLKHIALIAKLHFTISFGFWQHSPPVIKINLSNTRPIILRVSKKLMSAFIQTIKEESRQDCFNADVREHLYVTGTWYFLLLTIT